MPGPELSIAVKPPGGAWDRLSGVPEGYTHTHELPGGPANASWTQKRDARSHDPQHLPFTEVASLIGGVNAWNGRMMRAPRSRNMESIVSPVAEGWWTSHLNDFPIDREWVISDLSQWVDTRSYPDTPLNSFMANGQVQAGDHGILLSYPNGVPILAGSWLAATIDLGPNSRAKTISVDLATSFNTSQTSWYIRGHDTIPGITSGSTQEDLPSHSAIAISAFASITTGGLQQFTTARRYVTIFLYTPTAYTPGADVWVRITGARVVTSTAYLSGQASALKASTVLSEALALAPRISTDLSGITATTFNIPAYGSGGRRSIADIANDVNAYHQWQPILTNDPLPRPIFRPVPTTPTWVVHESDAYEYDDAGANEGAEVIDTCIVQYSDASGVPAEAVATTSGAILSKVGYSRARILQARSRLTAAAALQLAQAYLAAYQSSPFKGKVRIRGTITRYADGARIPVGLIPAGDAVVLGAETNPNTGAPGRIGIIQKVAYRHDTLEAELELDSARNYMDAILARLAIVVR